MIKFNFENAFMHFARTGAPRGFVWKFALAYAAVSILLFIVMMIFFGGAYAAMMQAAMTNDPDAIANSMSGGTLALIYLVGLPLSLFVWAIFESAALRRYIRKDTFSLRLGGDEGRVFVVLLCWVLFFILVTIVASIIVGILAAAIGSPAVITIIGIAVAIGVGYLAARFSPAAAMTIRDRKIRFIGAWGVTQGKGWTLFGAYLVWILLALVAYFVVILIAASVIGLGAAGMDPNALESGGGLMAGLGIGMLIFYLLVLAAYGAFLYIYAGPAALAARTDANYVDHETAVFD